MIIRVRSNLGTWKLNGKPEVCVLSEQFDTMRHNIILLFLMFRRCSKWRNIVEGPQDKNLH